MKERIIEGGKTGRRRERERQIDTQTDLPYMDFFTPLGIQVMFLLMQSRFKLSATGSSSVRDVA
jgi:hypothetical protein